MAGAGARGTQQVRGADAQPDIVEVAVQVELTLRCASNGPIICPGNIARTVVSAGLRRSMGLNVSMATAYSAAQQPTRVLRLRPGRPACHHVEQYCVDLVERLGHRRLR
jgi:hypothetical protein